MHKKVLAFILSVTMLLSTATTVFASASEPLVADCYAGITTNPTLFCAEGESDATSRCEPIQTVSQQEDHSHEQEPPQVSEEEKPVESTPPAESPVEKPEQSVPSENLPEIPETEAPAPNAPELSPDPIEPPIVDSGNPPDIGDAQLPPPTQEAAEYTIVELRTSEAIVVMGVLDSGGDAIRPRIVGSRLCVFRDCTNYVTVTSKYDYVCNAHKCAISGCSSPVYNLNPNRCQSHSGMANPICQIYTPGNPQDLCGKPSVAQGAIACYEHHCPGCLGIGNGNATICDICRQCWVPGCPNASTCTNECNTHCPHTCKTHHKTHRCNVCHDAGNCCSCNTCSHSCKTHHTNHCLTCHGAGNCCACGTCAHTCKTHHQTHCLTCHTAPCVCYPVNPSISVSGWNSGNNSITATISSARATQIEIYNASNQLVQSIGGASGSHTFYYNAAHHNGSYYVRVKNAAGYNPTSFPFTVSGLDRAAPTAHAVSLTPSGWASSKTLAVTVSDQTNARFELLYANGTPVSYCSAKEGAASGGRFTTSWTISEHITAPKTFRLVTIDRWGYSSSYDFTVNQIDTTTPTTPGITKSPNKEWHNGTVSLATSGGSAPSGIAGYEYRTNGGAWQSGGSFSLSAQGEYAVEARAISNAGLRSAAVSTIVKIDTAKPGGSYTLSHQPGTWTTDAVKITFHPTDTGGSGVQSVTLPNGQLSSNLNSITYTASQNGGYAFTVTDYAGNSETVVVNVEYIAMLDVTVTLSAPFVISPDDDAVYGGDIRFENHSNVPVSLTMQKLEPIGNAPQLVAPDSRNWKSLSVRDTQQYAALGFVGNGKDFWQNGTAQSLGTLAKNSAATFSLKAKHGYAWENPQSLLYAMTMKVSIHQ